MWSGPYCIPNEAVINFWGWIDKKPGAALSGIDLISGGAIG